MKKNNTDFVLDENSPVISSIYETIIEAYNETYIEIFKDSIKYLSTISNSTQDVYARSAMSILYRILSQSKNSSEDAILKSKLEAVLISYKDQE